MSHSANLIIDLCAALGPAHVLQGADMARYCTDWTTHYTAAPLVAVSYTHLDVYKRQSVIHGLHLRQDMLIAHHGHRPEINDFRHLR